jgi:RHS repeat-associated protein
VRYFHFDHLGSTLALTTAAGAVSDAYSYTPYGELTARTGTNAQPFTYIGCWGVRNEPSANLYDMRARYYDPATSRFLSRDPGWPRLGDSLAANPYEYAARSPLRFIDPIGTDEFDGAAKYMGNKILPDQSLPPAQGSPPGLESLEDDSTRVRPESVLNDLDPIIITENGVAESRSDRQARRQALERRELAALHLSIMMDQLEEAKFNLFVLNVRALGKLHLSMINRTLSDIISTRSDTGSGREQSKSLMQGGLAAVGALLQLEMIHEEEEKRIADNTPMEMKARMAQWSAQTPASPAAAAEQSVDEWLKDFICPKSVLGDLGKTSVTK